MHPRIILFAHDIRSLWNIGALFRCCDCFAAERLILAGYTALPPRREIAKTALGAEEWIAWEKTEDPLKTMHALKSDGWTIIGLETLEDAVPLQNYAPPAKTCVIVGHEVLGVPREILDCCDTTVAIPMHGKKHSLNVSVAAGIALAHLRNSPHA